MVRAVVASCGYLSVFDSQTEASYRTKSRDLRLSYEDGNLFYVDYKMLGYMARYVKGRKISEPHCYSRDTQFKRRIASS